MKKILIVTAMAALLTSCKTSQLGTGTDDVYANPKEEKELKKQAAVEKAKQDALEKRQAEERQTAQKAKEDSNPYYKDPEYSPDDYYDYEYASRINRFYNPIGVGYYDNYYTNMYTYNQNPYMYGTSIYSSYNWGMPSSQFNNYSIGISTGWGYGNGWNRYNSFGYYDPWCNPYGYYNNWNCGNNFYGYNNWGYSNGYYNGYNQGYYNGLNNAQWGYYNMFDVNSGYGKVQYGPRGSNGGGNSGRRTSAGMDIPEERGLRNSYIENIAEKQAEAPRFETPRSNSNSGNTTQPTGRRIYENGSQPVNGQPENVGSEKNQGRRSTRRNDQPQQNNNQPAQRGNNTWESSPRGNNSGGNSSPAPRNSGGGGSRRPR